MTTQNDPKLLKWLKWSKMSQKLRNIEMPPFQFESDGPVLAKDASTKDDDWFDIYDPRNPVNKRRRERDSKKSKK